MKLFGTETKQQRIDRLEAERVQKSNHQREIENARGYVVSLELMLFQSRDRISEMKEEISELEKQVVSRGRKLASAKAKLAMMESAA